MTGYRPTPHPLPRPGFVAMLMYCKENPVQFVLITRPERLVRSSLDYTVCSGLLRKYGVMLRSIADESGLPVPGSELKPNHPVNHSINSTTPASTHGRIS